MAALHDSKNYESAIAKRAALPFPQAPIFSEAEKFAICEWIGQFRTTSFIRQSVKERFGKRLTHAQLSKYRYAKKWQPLIDRCRQQFVTQVMDIPITHKRIRLERMERLFQLAMRDRRPGWSKRRELLAILREAREEVDEKTTNFTKVVMTQMGNYTDEELQQRKLEIIARIKELVQRNPTLDIPVPGEAQLEDNRQEGLDAVTSDSG